MSPCGKQGGLRPSLAARAKLLAAVDTPGVAGGIAALAPAAPLPTPARTSGRTGSVEQVVAADGVALPAARAGARRNGYARALSAHQARAAQPSRRAVPPTGVIKATSRGAPSASA